MPVERAAVQVTQMRGVWVLILQGPFAEHAAKILRRRTRELLAQSTKPITVDLSRLRCAQPGAVQYAVAELVDEAQVGHIGVRLVCDRTEPSLARILQHGGGFEIYFSLAEALYGFGQPEAQANH